LPILQARITNLQAALGPLKSAEKTFELHVYDPFCNPNDGVFHVALAPTGSTVTRSSGTPDLSLQIGTLSQLVAGALSPAGAARAGLLEGDVEVAEALASPSARRVTFMPSSDYF
jgi:predicted acetyltransferase